MASPNSVHFPHLPVTGNQAATRNFEHIQKKWGQVLQVGRDTGAEASVQVGIDEYVQSGQENVTFNLPDPGTHQGHVVGALYYGTVLGKAVVKTAGNGFYGAGWRGETEVRLRPGDFFYAIAQPLASVGSTVWIVIAPTRSDRTLVTGTSIAATITNPYDGQEVEYQNTAMAEQGVVWRFRYRAGSGSAFKWEFVGGPPLTSDIGASEETGGGAWSNLATFGPSLTTPTAGVYNFEWGAAVTGTPNAAFIWYLSLYSGGVIRETLIAATTQGGATFGGTLASKWALEVAAGVAYQLAYGVVNVAAKYHDRFLTIQPVRVS